MKFHEAHSQCWGYDLLTCNRQVERGWPAVIAMRHPATPTIYGVQPVCSQIETGDYGWNALDMNRKIQWSVRNWKCDSHNLWFMDYVIGERMDDEWIAKATTCPPSTHTILMEHNQLLMALPTHESSAIILRHLQKYENFAKLVDLLISHCDVGHFSNDAG